MRFADVVNVAPVGRTCALPGSRAVRKMPQDDPSGFLASMKALPAGHPSRAALRDRAIEAWLPLTRRLAGRFCGRGEAADDVVQTAVVGLIKAVDRFDPEYGVDFVAYAIPTIVGEIKRHFRDRTWTVRVPRRLQELRLTVVAAQSELTLRLQRSPTVAEIAAHLDIGVDAVVDGLEGARVYRTRSLSAPIVPGGDADLIERLGEEEHGYAITEARVALAPALSGIDDRSRTILTLRFYGNLTQAEIAGRLGISQMHVSRLIARALLELRRHLEAG